MSALPTYEALRAPLLTSTALQVVLRASTLPAYLDCQLRAAAISMPLIFKDHGLEIGPARGNIGALFGSGVHFAAEVGLRERMAGSLTPLSALQDAGIEGFRVRAREERERVQDIVMDTDTPSYDDAEKQILRGVQTLRSDVIERAYPVAVESRVNAEFRPGVLISGQADLLHLDMMGGTIARVRDLKTSRRVQPPTKHMAQVGAYSLLFRSLELKTDAAQIDLLKRVKLAKPQPPIEAQPLDVGRSEAIAYATVTDFADKAQAFVKDGEVSRFLLNPSSLLCSPRYCRLYGTTTCAATTGAPTDAD